jgi:hypothetical protein
MKNCPVFVFDPERKQFGFSAFTPWGRGKKAEKPNHILIFQSRINVLQKLSKKSIFLTGFIPVIN